MRSDKIYDGWHDLLSYRVYTVDGGVTRVEDGEGRILYPYAPSKRCGWISKDGCRLSALKTGLTKGKWELRPAMSISVPEKPTRGEIAGQKRGKLTAIRYTGEKINGHAVWEWRCECGATVIKSIQTVGAKKSTMCPACASKLKAEQAFRMQSDKRDPKTGMMPGAVRGILEGKTFCNNSSGVRGVTWYARGKKWRARVEINGKTRTVGHFDTIAEAAEARKKAVEEIYGEK